MQDRKSHRHQRAAEARWRAAEVRARAEREGGIPDRQLDADTRQPITLDLRSAGGPLVTLEPRAGYIGWRMRDERGMVNECAALKTLLHRMADRLPRTMGVR